MLTGESLLRMLVVVTVTGIGFIVFARLLELLGDIGYLLTGSKLLEPADMEYRSHPLRRATYLEKKAQIQAENTASDRHPDPLEDEYDEDPLRTNDNEDTNSRRSDR